MSRINGPCAMRQQQLPARRNRVKVISEDGQTGGEAKREPVHGKISDKRFPGIQQDTYGSRRVARSVKNLARDPVVGQGQPLVPQQYIDLDR